MQITAKKDMGMKGSTRQKHLPMSESQGGVFYFSGACPYHIVNYTIKTEKNQVFVFCKLYILFFLIICGIILMIKNKKEFFI